MLQNEYNVKKFLKNYQNFTYLNIKPVYIEQNNSCLKMLFNS